MIKIVISAVAIIISMFVYFKLLSPIIVGIKGLEMHEIYLKRKINNYNSQLFKLKGVKLVSLPLKSSKISTYMFTFLSFVSYLKNDGFRLNIKLVNNTPVTSNSKMTTSVPVVSAGFKPYEFTTKYSGVKKIKVILTFKGYPGVESILSLMNKFYLLFPIKFTGLKISMKSTVIDFNLYSFKEV